MVYGVCEGVYRFQKATNGGVPPKSCPNGGKISISTLYGNAEMIVQAGAYVLISYCISFWRVGIYHE